MSARVYISIPVYLFLILFPLIAEQGLAGAGLPYSDDWYRNPALQGSKPPEQVFSSTVSLPAGLLNLLNPDVLPAGFTDGSGLKETDNLDLLSLYIQLSNPFIFIPRLPESPDEIYIYVSQESINITDNTGTPLPLSNIPGMSAASVGGTPLIPLPLLSFSFGNDNFFWGFGLFGGTSGLSVSFDDAAKDILAEMEITPGDEISLSADFSARAGLFEYINLVSDAFVLSADAELELAGRIFFYETLAGVDASATLGVNVSDDYIYSEFWHSFDLFYLYPGTGIGLGARFDWGTVLRISNWIFGVSILNLPGIEYSGGMRVTDDGNIPYSSLVPSFRPYFLVHGSCSIPIGDGLTLIPVVDTGFGKNWFTHAAAALFWRDFCFKTGLAYEDRFKGSFGAGFRVERLSVESGLSIQQSVFNNAVAGIYLSAGIAE